MLKSPKFFGALSNVFGVLVPILSSLDTAQASCDLDKSKVYFLVWTKNRTGDEDLHNLLPYSNESIEESMLDGELLSYIFFHDYLDSGIEQWILDSKSEILTSKDANIISICYEEVFSDLEYEQAIAEYVAKVLDWISDKIGIKSSRQHMIGHSLGAHIAGFTAQNMKRLPAGKVRRVTGLDPAGPSLSPLFRKKKFRIDKSQAKFVVIIHTNACDKPLNSSNGCYGLVDNVGHADFYNGGMWQTRMQQGNVWFWRTCKLSHQRVTDLLIESIKNSGKTFQSWRCRSWSKFKKGGCKKCPRKGCAIMGLHVSR
ncbi:Lipoprotein lipase, partial [Armadillidium nasatum]